MNKIAKEMFEELGYTERHQDEYYTKSIKIFDGKQKYWDGIYFDYDKTIDVSGQIISFELLQAINKQIEELGWNNE